MNSYKNIGKESSGGFRWGHWLLVGGCGLVCGTMLILIGLAFVVPRVLDSMIETYTDEQAVAISLVPLSDDELETLENRIDEFTARVDEGEWTRPLKLSENDINGLVQKEMDDFGGAIKFRFRDNQVIGNLSIPLDADFKLGPWERTLAGRHLNGQAAFDLSIEKGVLELNLVEFEVSGKKLPGWILSQVQDRIDKERWLDDEDIQEFTRKIDSLEVRNKEIVLRAAGN